MNYIAPWWLPGGQAQTIWPALYARRQQTKAAANTTPYRRERWTTPDGDFIDLDWLHTPLAATLLVLFHGLEGSSTSHYALAFAEYAQQRGFNYVVPHFRGCSGQINLAPRAYHSGDFEEIGWVLQGLRQKHAGRILAVGVSLGGNALFSIQVPTLLVNALNDPFVPGHSLPHMRSVGHNVTLWQPRHGGHVGFAGGQPPGHLRSLPEQVGGWLAQHGVSHG